MTCVGCSGYLCLILKIVSLGVSLAGLGIPYWYKGDAVETAGLTGTVKETTREGLWKTCTDLDSTSDSSSYCVDNEATTAIQATRGTLMAAAGFVGIAILAAGAALMEKNRTAYLTAGVCGLISLAFSLISLAIYGVKVKDELNFTTGQLYIGYWLPLLGAVLTLIASLLAFVLARLVKYVEKKEDAEKPT